MDVLFSTASARTASLAVGVVMKGAFSHATGSRLCIHLAHHIRLLACGWPRTLHPPPPVEFHSRTPRSHPWLQAPGHRHAVAVHRPTHRRAARAGDIACSKHCRELERLTWSSPRIGTASPRRALHSALCRLEPPSSSPPPGSACPLHARCSAACHRQQLPCAWGSPRAGSVFLLRARCSGACRRQQPIWGSPRAGSACPRHAPGNSPCRLDPLWCSPPAHTAACPWPSSLHVLPPKTPTHCDAPVPAVTHPLSALSDPLVHTGHHTHDGGSARAGQTLGSCVDKVVNSAWAGDVRWMCSRAGWTGTPPHPPPPGSQAAFRRAACGRFEHAHTATRRSTPRRRDTWSVSHGA
jgi:hypothetical protein